MAEMNRKQIVNAMINHVVNHGIYGMTVEGIEISQENYDKLVNMRKPLLADFLEKITSVTEKAEASVNADAHEETLGEEDLGDDRHSALEEPADAPVEEPVLNAESAQYFHMHFQANFQKKLNDGTQTPQDWGCAVTFRKLDDGKWVCQKSSTRNLQWMTKPKVVYAGKYEKGVEREVISVTERDIKMLKYWLTSGRYGKTMSQYFSNDELPNYDACEIGKPIYKDVREESSEIPF